MPPFEVPKAKVERARKQIAAFDKAVRDFYGAHPYRVVPAELNDKAQTYTLRIADFQELPLVDCSILIGEIAHDLRSALDQLVCELAILSNPKSDISICDDTAFPIYALGPRSGKRKDRFNPKTPRIRPLKRQFRAEIKRLQPYHRRNRQRKSPLWMLHELNNMDKHRCIAVVATSVASMALVGPKMIPGTSFMGGPMRFKVGVPMKNGANVGFAHRSYIEMNMCPQVGVQIAFGNGTGPVEREYVIRTMLRIAQEVEQIIEVFARKVS